MFHQHKQILFNHSNRMHVISKSAIVCTLAQLANIQKKIIKLRNVDTDKLEAKLDTLNHLIQKQFISRTNRTKLNRIY